MNIISMLSAELKLPEKQIQDTVKLMDEGNTIPFIARYRKEVTGSLDDEVLRNLSTRLDYLRGLEKRKEEVTSRLTELEKLTPELETAIEKAATMTEIEDIYRPYKQRRKTRADIAREKGLAPLAEMIMAQDSLVAPAIMAKDFISEAVETAGDALAGAMDIIAETISDDAELRKSLRMLIWSNGLISSENGKEVKAVYDMYSDFSQSINKLPPHRVLAMDRGEKENALKVSIEIDKDMAVRSITDKYVIQNNLSGKAVAQAALDSYTRLIFPSVSREIRNLLTDNACKSAINVFSVNLKQLLMQPPIKGKVTLAVDPGFRTGCKIAVVDQRGKVLDTGVIYPTAPHNKIKQAEDILTRMINEFDVEVIAIGNGTASRESESFVADLIKKLSKKVSYIIVSEAGASVYSASKLGATEFPQFDVSLRSAVSIARRLQDPLAELVKIDPKSIGVGQYQHDMPAKELDLALEGVVEGCVNSVGVDLNTASHSLLAYIAGISAATAKSIVTYREENGAFKTRRELLKVPKLGPKAFLQCAGFMRISEGKNFLDSTAVHPESYDAAVKILEICGFTKKDLKSEKVKEIEDIAKGIGIKRIADEIDIGEITVRDIISELVKPGRDPREDLPAPILRSDVLEMKDLKEGMELTGTVRNVIDFGAFIDIGVHQDGLVHISKISKNYIKHPSEVLKVGDIVKVTVIGIDEKRGRISLSMI